MRQRKVKNLDEKYNKYSDILVWKPEEVKGSWKKKASRISGGKGIYLEIGCGKGQFISQIAKKNSNCFFIAIEGNRSVMLRALEKVKKNDIKNVAFIPFFTENLHDWFEYSEIDGIYLNFSDPLPKRSMIKKRLTYRDKLYQYFDILKKDGIVTFKTDNTGLFEFTLQEVRAANLRILEITRDLHECENADDNIVTEYEKKFSELGEKIKRIKIGRTKMDNEIKNSMVTYNGRVIPKEDKIFGINNRAKKAIMEFGKENIINATVGALLDDEGKLVVLSSVDEAVKQLTPIEYAEYAPIGGTDGFKKAIIKAAFANYNIDRYIGVIATPGGTGAIRNMIANYSCPGDRILTHDWHWTPYNTIAMEQGRDIETFEMFGEDGEFNKEDFSYKVKKILRNQEHLLIILNTPASNPTGYSLSITDWEYVVKVLNGFTKDKKIALLIDVAYIDFAGEEKDTRAFLPVLEKLDENILPVLAYSTSKTFTFYGFRCGAMICMAPTEEILNEFIAANTFSSRGSWSNSPRAPQAVIEKIYNDEKLLDKVNAERKKFREMLYLRGKAFEYEAKKLNLEILPYRAGFFISIPCKNPDAISELLEKKNIFIVPMNKGIRVSLASISEEKCRILPQMIKNTIDDFLEKRV